jgi:hypothetical protein
LELKPQNKEIDWGSNCAIQVIDIRLKIVMTGSMIPKEIRERRNIISTLVCKVVKYKGGLGVFVG